jgi:hypothetical protein
MEVHIQPFAISMFDSKKMVTKSDVQILSLWGTYENGH